jgi:prolyl-tRNA synthetase
MKDSGLPSPQEDYNQWYNTLVRAADLADYGPVRGTMVVKPYGWAIWENLQSALDQRFKASGVQNAGFPMFIPMSFMQKEASHIEGFAPELAVVTHGGGEELAEPLVVRPTSETIIGHMFSNWIQSYRDLPLLINLWNSVVRWEMRTKLFLRTLEFYWQEGHTAHATAEEADERTRQMLDIYTQVAVDEAAIPVIPGEKSEMERFAGAQQTFSLEAMMGDRKALQSATSHNLGQNFSKAFDIQFTDENNQLQHAWTTSWGFSTRFVGAIIMTHGDEHGLVLPPRLAPIQVVLIPIFKNDTQLQELQPTIEAVKATLTRHEIRLEVDERSEVTPGFKFNYWELRGVPLRLEVGPRDLRQGSLAAARRDIPGRQGKSTLPLDNLGERVATMLEEIQANMLAKATAFRDEHTLEVENMDDFKAAVQAGFARVWWAGSTEDEVAIKAKTKATIRCFPLSQTKGEGTCFYTGQPANRQAVFGRAY